MPEMSAPRDQPTSSDHAAHDRFLVVGLVDRDDSVLQPDERARAEALVTACAECATLRDDLAAITRAVPGAAIPARPRAFTLTAADAERLRPRGPRRWLRSIGSPRDALSRPLAIGLTTIGLAGLLVATVPGALPFGSGSTSVSAPAPTFAAVGEGLAPAASAAPLMEAAESAATGLVEPAAGQAPSVAAAPSAAPVAPSPARLDTAAGSGDPQERSASGDVEASDVADEALVFGADQTLDGGAAGEFQGASGPDVATDEAGVSTLAVLAGTVLIVGLGLFALRWSNRRFGG